jgi:hypothetical protein
MKSSTRVVLTETAVVILSANNSLMTSIPLRMWTTQDGRSWSSRARTSQELERLIQRLGVALQDASGACVMKRVLKVLFDERPILFPSLWPNRSAKSGRTRKWTSTPQRSSGTPRPMAERLCPLRQARYQ